MFFLELNMFSYPCVVDGMRQFLTLTEYYFLRRPAVADLYIVYTIFYELYMFSYPFVGDGTRQLLTLTES